MPPELIALDEGIDILLDKPIMLLGRHQECDIQLNSRKVSRRHCCIAQVGKHLVVRDLCSTNGIRINGEKAMQGRLSPGDVLTIGNFNFEVRWRGHPDQRDSSLSNGQTHQPAHGLPASGSGSNDPLLSCELPVPLPEPLQRDRDDDDRENDLDESSDKNPSSNRSPEDQGPSLILPDQIDLAPSDEFPRVP
jgi:predicted component of type VI protein secretion system